MTPPVIPVMEMHVPEQPTAVKLPEIESPPPPPLTNGEAKAQPKPEPKSSSKKHAVPPKPRKILTEKEADKILKALAMIDEGPLSDVDDGSFYEQKEQYKQKSRKRAADIGEAELQKRKVSDQVLPDPSSNR